LALNEKGGSSPYAIAKYMEENHKALPANFKKTLALQLKNSEARGKLVKVKASYKLSEAGEKDKTHKSTGTRTTRASSKPKEEKTEKKSKSTNLSEDSENKASDA
ncbi:Histone H1, partial [Trichinella nelsoni]